MRFVQTAVGFIVLHLLFLPSASAQTTISGISPTSGSVGSAVAINGTNFGAIQGNSTVALNAMNLAVTSWSDSTIVVILPSGAASGTFAVSINGNTVTSSTFTVTALPGAWAHADIGSVSSAGAATYTNGTFNVSSHGLGLGGTTDTFHFVYQPLSGDGTIVARVASESVSIQQVGVMIRESLAANSSAAFGFFRPNSGFLYYRPTTGASYSSQSVFFSGPAAPYWMKLARSGSTFTGYVSLDGLNWTQTGSTTITMAQNVYIGMVLPVGSASFDSVSIDSPSAPAPVISSLSATTGSVGSSVTITGLNFGSGTSGGLVAVNGIPMPVTSWSDTSVTATIPSTATSGPILVSVGPNMNCSNYLYFEVTSQPLPTPWLNRDVGTVSQPGNVGYTGGTFTINASGSAIGGTSDALHFVYQALSGNGSIVARVSNFSGDQPVVMIRETLASNSAGTFVLFRPNSAYLYYRPSTGASYSSSSTFFSNPAVPYWMKLVRSGNTFTGYISGDALNWTLIASTTISIAQSVYIGLAEDRGTGNFDYVSVDSAVAPAPVITGLSATTTSVGSQVTITGSHFGTSQGSSQVTLRGIPATASSWNDTSIVFTVPVGATSGLLVVSVAPTMNNSNPVLLAVTAQPLPSGWFDAEVNPVGLPGTATYSAGTFALTAHDSGIGGGTSDSFHFAYDPVSGDGSITARVSTLQGGAEAGIMIRESLAAGASHAFSYFRPNQAFFYDRPSTGASAAFQSLFFNNPTAPYWVKLVRNGSTFFSFFSPDGIAWMQIGTGATVTMGQTADFGLAAASGSTSTLGIATFDNVVVALGTTPNITSVSPGTAAVGTSVTITGTSFGATQGTSQVKFNGAIATSITTWSDTQIVAIVPDAATSGPLTVTANNIESTHTTNFTVPPPNITGVSPAGGALGAQFTVTGSGFQNNQRNSTINIKGTVATVVTWSDLQIVAQVPSGASTGPLSVLVNSISSNLDQVFTVVSPTISYLAPPAGAIGGTITVNGTGFGASQGSSSVNFNGVAGSIKSWSDTSITVTIPSGITSGPLTVTNFNATSNGVQFNLEGAPAISTVSPQTGYIGITVTINGSGFGATQSNSTVIFTNGVTATPTTWSDTQIVVPAPEGAAYGPVQVAVAGLTANGPNFDLLTVAALTDSLGHQSAYIASVRGGDTRIAGTDGPGCSSCTMRGPSQNTYDSKGNVLTSTDALGHVTTYTYDAQNNLLTESRQLDANTTATTTYTYNSFGEVLTVTDPLSNVTTNTYDAKGNLLTVAAPAPDANTPASITTFTYDPNNGELLTIKDPLNHVSTLAYTPEGYIHTITDANSKVTRYEYDARGNRTDVYDALNHHTQFQYDPATNFLKKITYDDGTYAQFGYDGRGRRTSVTDQNQHTTTYAYDDADRLTSVTDAATNQTQYAYDTEGNLLSITDAMNRVTSFGYDIKGRLTQTTFPSTLSETYTYDAIDNLLSKTDRKSQTINYVYDALDRLTHKGYPDSTGVDYIYDLVGKIKQVTDPTGTYGFAYDNMGRLLGTTTQYTFIPNQTFSNSYSYDAASNRTGFTAPDSSTTSYGYDALNRLTDQTNSWAGHYIFGYDDLSRRTSLTRPNGINTSYAYDNVSRLSSVLHQQGATTVDGAIYTYDNAGNRLSKQNLLNNITEHYDYDAIYQLKHVIQDLSGGGQTTTESYTYDQVGNRLSSLDVSQYNYDSSNHLNSSSDGVTYTYDNNGNTLTKTDANGTTQYAWDFENRLTSVTLPGSGGVVSFRYDPFGKRIQKSSTGQTTSYIYDGGAIIVELNSAGDIRTKYAQGSETDEPLAISASGLTNLYNADGLGSVTSLTDAVGGLATTNIYDAFGRQTTITGAIPNPFRYTGREYDNELGIYYYRARYHDQAAGRFLSEDPLRSPIRPNRYAYVRNNPLNRVDSSGMRDRSRRGCDLVATLRQLLWTSQSNRTITSDWHFLTSNADGPDGLFPGSAIQCWFERTYTAELWGHYLVVHTYRCWHYGCMSGYSYYTKRTAGIELEYMGQTTGAERTSTRHIGFGVEDETNDILCATDPRLRP